MSFQQRFLTALSGLFLTLAPHGLSAQTNTTECDKSTLDCPYQGWTEAQRSWWYTATQGSRFLPLSWAIALQSEDGSQKQFGPQMLRDFGFLDNPASTANPYGLPVGFAIDHVPGPQADIMCDTFPETCAAGTMRDPWVGLTCAACHTNEYAYQGKRLRIEGAPTLIDFTRFVDETEAALQATLDTPDRFDAFAHWVLQGRKDPQTRASLRTQMAEQVTWLKRQREINGNDVEAGPARLDAQGTIFGKVAMIIGADDHPPGPKADAPASYPFIWNTHQQPILQWNGIAPKLNTIDLLPGRPVELGALIRNTSEVIGVFGHIDASQGAAWSGYESSIDMLQLDALERLLAQLNSPAWPADIFGQINEDLKEQGEDLYTAHCADCHAPLERGDLVSTAEIHLIPLTEIGTDIFLACNTFLRRMNAGNLVGQKGLGLIGDPINAVDAAQKMLVNAAAGAIIKKGGDNLAAVFKTPNRPAVAPPKPNGQPGEGILPNVNNPVKKALAQQCLTLDHRLLQYKARPLNGIWATAPYLHNGSVPSLYDLLLPAKDRNIADASRPEPTGQTRPESFGVGGITFDPLKVGFVTDTDPQINPWVFQVRDPDGGVIAGNSNAGHEYGTTELSDQERWALIEYLKSL